MKEIVDFIKKPGEKKKIIVVVGPTAAGKSSLAIKIAKKLNAEIINADSRQVYKEIAKTSGSVSPEEQDGIKHHLLNFISVQDEYNSKLHQKNSLEIINDIHIRGKVSILCGGTGLFIDSILFDYQFAKTSSDTRAELEKKDITNLWQELLNTDPSYAKRIDAGNKRRIIRALDAAYSGKKLSELKNREKQSDKFDYIIVTPKIISRENLYNDINIRMLNLWHEGIKSEAKKLQEMKANPNLPALSAIGLKEAFALFEGKISEELAIASMQKRARNYAKRQLTWWKNRDLIEIN